MSEKKNLIEFPCDFSLKVLGNNKDCFTDDIVKIIRSHFPDFNNKTISSVLSKNQSYISLTITINVISQEKLDAIYNDITKHPEVKWVL